MSDAHDYNGLRSPRQLQDQSPASGKDTHIIRDTFKVYGSFFLVLFTLFCILRKKYQRFFNVRSWSEKVKSSLASDTRGFVAWIWRLYKISDDEILENCGMDALCFLRVLSFGLRVSCLGIFNSFWLFPLYKTAPNVSETEHIQDRVEELTTSHVPSESRRFIATVVAAYIFFLFTMYQILQEFEWYTKYRHRFLSKRMPRNYAVFVSGIPEEYRSSHALLQFFRDCFSKDGVLEAHVAIDIPNLERQVAHRDALVARLEHAIGYQSLRGKTPTHRKSVMTGDLARVDTILSCREELESVNANIDASIRKIKLLNNPFCSNLERTEAILVAQQMQEERESPTRSLSKPSIISRQPSINLPLFPLEEGRGDDAFDQANQSFAIDLEALVDGSADYDVQRQPTVPSVCRVDGESFGVPFLGSEEESEDEMFLEAEEEPDPVGNTHEAGNDLLDASGTGDLENRDANEAANEFYTEVVLCESEMDSPPTPNKHHGANYEGLVDNASRDIEQDSRPSLAKSSATLMGMKYSSHSLVSTASFSSKSDADELQPPPPKRKRSSLYVPQVTEIVYSGSRQVYKVVSGGTHHVKKAVAGGGTHVKRAMHHGTRQVTKVVNAENIKKITDKGVGGIVKATGYGLGHIKKATDVGAHNLMFLANTAATFILRNGDGKPREAGFVVFSKLSTTQAALQMVHHPTPFLMDIQEAPDPDDIYWTNVGMPHHSRKVGFMLSMALSAVLCVFWTIPVSFVSSLTEVESLKKSIPFLENWINDAPWLQPAMEQVAPLMLLFLNLLLPFALRQISKLEGHIASSALEASLFIKLAAFMIIQTFFVSAISGGIMAELNSILKRPSSFIDLLANSLPAQSTYFVQIILVTTFFGQALELLRVYPLGMAWLRRRVGPNLTEKERNTTYMELHPLADPMEFQHAEVFGQTILYFMVMFVYSTLAPMVNYFLAFCFLIMGSGYRHQFVYNYPKNPDSGGKLWSGFIGIALTCMLVAQITLVGLLALKKATFATPFLIPLMIITILFNLYIRLKHFRVTNHLPTRDCLKLDKQRHLKGKVNYEFLRNKYLQPALQPTHTVM